MNETTPVSMAKRQQFSWPPSTVSSSQRCVNVVQAGAFTALSTLEVCLGHGRETCLIRRPDSLDRNRVSVSGNSERKIFKYTVGKTKNEPATDAAITPLYCGSMFALRQLDTLLPVENGVGYITVERLFVCETWDAEVAPSGREEHSWWWILQFW